MRLQSLREILLQATVKQFDKVFLDCDDTQGYVLKQDIRLTPHLFEDIQSKGNDIGWQIPDQFLKPCLASRDALKWTNVDLLYGHYELSDLLRVQEANLPLIQFSVRVIYLVPELVQLLRKYSQTLEIIQIGLLRMRETKLCFKGWFRPILDEPLRFPKLRKLSINFNVTCLHIFNFIDFKSCSGTLKSLELLSLGVIRTSCGRNYFTESVSYFHTLDHLAIETPTFDPTLKMFLTELESLRSLKMFGLTLGYSETASSIEQNILTTSPTIKHLNLSCIDPLFEALLDSIIFRELETPMVVQVFGIPNTTIKTLVIEKKAIKSFSSTRMDLLLTNFERSIFDELFPKLDTNRIITMLEIDSSHVTNSQWQRLEKVILILVQKYWSGTKSHPIENARTIFTLADDKYCWSKHFIRKFANMVVNMSLFQVDLQNGTPIWLIEIIKSRQMLSFLLDYITRNQDINTSSMYLKYLLLSFYKLYECYHLYQIDAHLCHLVSLTTYIDVSSVVYRKTEVSEEQSDNKVESILGEEELG